MQSPSSFTPSQQWITSVAPVLSGIVSVAGWCCIGYATIRDWKTYKHRLKNRIILALCVSDVINSFTFILWAPPIPKETPGVWGAIGTQKSCKGAGFCMQLGLLGSFYIGALSLYFMKSICDDKSDQEIATRYELLIHATAILWSLGTAVASYVQDLYAYNALGCWIAPEPRACPHHDDVECERGGNAVVFASFYTGIPLILIFVYITYAMARIYKTVRVISQRSGRWTVMSYEFAGAKDSRTFSSTSEVVVGDQSPTPGTATPSGGRNFEGQASPRHTNRTREAAVHALLHILIYCVTRVWAFVVYNAEAMGHNVPFWCIFLQQVFWPLQGISNVFLLLRPRIATIRRRTPGISYGRAAYVAVFGSPFESQMSSQDFSHRVGRTNRKDRGLSGAVLVEKRCEMKDTKQMDEVTDSLDCSTDSGT